MAFCSLELGEDWVKDNIKKLEFQREATWNAISFIKGAIKSDGAFYFFVPLPEGMKDVDAVTYLAKEWYNINTSVI